MSGLEQAIRNALERADRANPDIRSRIYQSARNALDAGLRKQEVDDPSVIERQRQRLEITIRGIEDEELERLRAMARLEKVMIENAPEDLEPPAEPEPDNNEVPIVSAEPMVAAPAPIIEVDARPAPSADRVADDGSLSDLSAERDTPVKSRRPRTDQLSIEPEDRRAIKRRKSHKHEEEDAAWAEASTPEGQRISPEKRSRRRRSTSWMVSLFVYIVLIGIVLAGVWWIYATGMLGAALNGTSNFDLIPKELQAEDFDPKKEKNPLDPLRGFSGEWVDIFKPSDADSVKASSGATVKPVTDSDGAAVTIASNAPDQDGEVRIQVPANVLQDLAGKTSTIAVTMRSDNDQAAQIYVQCEFTTLGDCGRHRFTVSNERADALIQVKYDGKLGPNEPGYIVINSDLTGDGRAIRLYGIRVLPGS